MRRYKLIINPVSGNRKYERFLNRIIDYFISNGYSLDISLTLYPGHGIQLARESAIMGNYEAIIGAGGDGTINEVINGVISSGKKIPVGILPFGTGNVFALETGIPLDPIEATKIITKTGVIREVDVGKIKDRYFLLMVSCGIDAYTIKNTNLRLKKIIGNGSYVMAFFKTLFFKYKFPKIKVIIENDGVREETEGIFIVIGNSKYYAGKFSLTPFADFQDGFLDVFIYREKGILNTILLALRVINAAVFKKNFLVLTKQAYFKAKKITLIPLEGPVYTQLDGELFEPLPLEIEIVPKALRLILPK